MNTPEIPVSQIRYIARFNQNRNTSKTITHAELDSKSPEFFKSGFAEMIPSTGVRRLFFDVELDEYKESWLKDVISWLDTLAEVLKTRYAACGYTIDNDFMTEYEDDEDMQNKLMLDFKNDANLKHAISFHVIFQKVFETKDLFKVLCNPKCIFVKEGVDMSVYKDENKQQLLRHAFSIKNKSLTDICHTEIDFTAITQLYKASELVVTPDGSEEVGTLEELEEAFVYEEVKEILTTQTPRSDDDDEIDPEKLFVEQEHEQMTKEMFEALYKGFKDLMIHGDAEKCDKEISLFPLFSALYACINDNINDEDVDEALDFIQKNAKLTPNASKKWNSQLRRAMKNEECKGPGALFKYVHTFNPEYFNTTIKPLLPKRKPVVEVTCDISDKFCAADVTIKAENHGYQEIDTKMKYANIDYAEPSPFIFNYQDALNDLKRCMVVINKAVKTFYFKELDGFTNTYSMVEYKQSDAKEYLGNITMGTEYKYNKKNDDINDDLKRMIKAAHKLNQVIDPEILRYMSKTRISALELYLSHQSMFSYKAVTFYSTNPEVYSIFKGYKYNQTEKYDMELIQPFINFVHDVIANGRDDVANYLHAWFQSILKNPTYKTGVAIILKGKQGTGKNTFTDALCALLGDYAMPNVSNIDNLTGRFNSSIINKKIIVVNELKSAENHAIGTADTLKTLITDYYMNLEQKCVDVKTNVVQVANFIINTNNIKPLTISEDDRRMCVLTPNPKYANDKAYFLNLRKTMFVNPEANDSAYRDDFMQALISYYWYTDFGIKPETLRNIPQTDERRALINMSKPFTFNFIAKHFDEYTSKKGIVIEVAYQKYLSDFKDIGYGKKLNENEFYDIMKTEYCGKAKQIRLNGQRPYAWKLNEELNAFNELKEANERMLVPANFDLDEEEEDETPEEKRERLNAELLKKQEAIKKMQDEIAKMQEELDGIPIKL